MEAKPRDPANFLESSVLLDETQCDEVFKDGYNGGLVSGKEEGKEVGLKLGFQVGEELGFYQGCLDVWSSAIHVSPDAFSSRVHKRVEQLAEVVKKYPFMQPEYEDIQEMMDSIRLKVRIISANLRVRLEYEGQCKSSKPGMEDV